MKRSNAESTYLKGGQQMIVINIDANGKVIKDFSKAKFPEEMQNAIVDLAKCAIQQERSKKGRAIK